MAIKEYDVWCYTKANSNEYLHHAVFSAESAKAARECMKTAIRVALGRHAFRVTTVVPEKLCERLAERNGVSAKLIAYNESLNHGWAIYA